MHARASQRKAFACRKGRVRGDWVVYVPWLPERIMRSGPPRGGFIQDGNRRAATRATMRHWTCMR
jgi:hypothetical protein